MSDVYVLRRGNVYRGASGVNAHVQSRVADALRALRRLADTSERSGYLIAAIAAREAAFDVSEAVEREREFREGRGLRG